MKLVIATFDEPFFVPDLFGPLIKKNSKDIKAIIIVPQKRLSWREIKLGGASFVLSKAMAFLLEAIKLQLGISERSLISLGKKHSIPLFKTASINSYQTEKILIELAPDVVIVQVPEIVKPKILKIAKIGFINKHASLLPKYRGLLPIFWALLSGEKEIGYTFHFIDDKIDQGKIIYQEKIKVEPTDTVNSLYKKVFKRSGKSLLNLIENLKRGKSVQRKTTQQGSYFSYPDNESIKKFHEQGLKFS